MDVRLSPLARRLRRSALGFRSDAQGNVAILFGIALLPLAGIVGAALDYNRAIEFRSFAHREVDIAALAIASSDTPDAGKVIDGLKSRLAGYWGNSTLVTNVTVETDWVGSSVFTMTASANVATTLTSLLPSAPRNINVAVTTAVKRKPAEWEWSLPTIKDLDNEAWDYNRISVYCYDESKKGEADKGRRLETLTPISDNYGTDYSKARLPDCNPGETLSYKLWNVRNGKAPGQPNNLKWWQKNSRGQDPETVMAARSPSSTDYYSFYTDTTIDPTSRVVVSNVSGGKEDKNGKIATLSDVTSSRILETATCTTNVDCKPISQGGVLPNLGVRNKSNPQVATGSCADNKSMYYGWEDRPPSAGGSDRDYDDIRIIVSCPTLIKIADKEIRIVK